MRRTSVAFGLESPTGVISQRITGGQIRRVKVDGPTAAESIEGALEFRAPAGMRLTVLDTDPRALDDAQKTALRARIAFVSAGGGLVSHLNGWENAVLPLGYHRPDRLPSVVPRLLSLLDALAGDARGLAGKLPEAMTTLECKAVAFARALLLEPELLLVEDFAQGLTPHEQLRIDAFSKAFRDTSPDGSLLYIDRQDTQRRT